jgi:transketolase
MLFSAEELFQATEVCKLTRKSILEIANSTRAPHTGSSLSVVEIVVASYLYQLDELKKGNNHSSVVFSKGHASLALYSALAELEIISRSDLSTYNQDGSKLYGHVNHEVSTHIPLSTGSLGHGLPFSVGLAYSNILKGDSESKIITIMSDGELDEGSTWESALIASHLSLENLVVIIDRNRLQSILSTEETIALEPLDLKWQDFGWQVVEVDGHDLKELSRVISLSSGPLCVLANTIKGAGVSFMENKIKWHYKYPDDLELEKALNEIGIK